MNVFRKTVDDFYPKADLLRGYFDRLYEDPRAFKRERFAWDYWHVPGHYHHLRTPAYHFFPEKLYREFHIYLVEWGRRNLGCHDISPTWLSLYPEGSYQHTHVDDPHGPFAFVYSLTLNPRAFHGGRTVISNEFYRQGKGKEKEWSFPVEKLKHKISITPSFNRLILFDPSYPHGVSRVKGVEDPRAMRLVLHGWFVQPRPFWYGPLTVKDIQPRLDQIFERVAQCSSLSKGYLGFKFQVEKNGAMGEVSLLASTMPAAQRVLKELKNKLGTISFPSRSRKTEVVFPVMIG